MLLVRVLRSSIVLLTIISKEGGIRQDDFENFGCALLIDILYLIPLSKIQTYNQQSHCLGYRNERHSGRG